jgi:hypothetical protein
MTATYLTLFIISSLGPSDEQHMAYPYRSAMECSDVLVENSKALYEANLMARCIRTNIITSTSAPVLRPDHPN